MENNSQTTFLALGGTLALVGVGAIFFFYQQRTDEGELLEVGEQAQQAEQADPAKESDKAAADPTPTEVDGSTFRTLDSGLKIADIEVGTGDSPEEGQLVKVHYSGWLDSDGSMFDSSVKRGQPAEFPLARGSLIEGWVQGLADMKVGGKRQLVVPADLAYGEAGRPGIPPNSTLIFDIELLGLGEIRKVPELPETDWSTGTTLDKGIVVIDLAPGEGAEIKDRTLAAVELSLWRSDGELFFSSYSRQGQGATPRILLGAPPPAGEPLVGIGIALDGLKAGSSRIAKLPPEVAFGDEGLGDQVPPNETMTVLIDVVEVGEVRRPPSAPPKVSDDAIKTSDSGLKYADLEVGEGASPSEKAGVEIEYTGWTPDGELVESTYDQGMAARFMLGRTPIMPAWKEALATMKPGGKRLLIIPPYLGYGPTARPRVPPNVELTYVIELKGVHER